MTDNRPEPAQQGFNLFRRVAGVDQHVGGERLVSGRNCPGVDVVDEGHARNLLQRAAKMVHIEMGRDQLQQNPKDVDGQADGTDQDQGGDEETEDGVNQVPVEEQRDEAGDQDGDDAQHIGHDVPEDAFDDETVARRALQDHGGSNLDDQSDEGDGQHDATIDLVVVAVGVLGEALVSLVANPTGEHPQGDGVEHHDQDFDALEAEGAGNGGRALGDPHGEEGQAHGRGVGNHVGGVGQETQAARHDAADYINRQMGEQQAEDNPQGALAGAAQIVTGPRRR